MRSQWQRIKYYTNIKFNYFDVKKKRFWSIQYCSKYVRIEMRNESCYSKFEQSNEVINWLMKNEKFFFWSCHTFSRILIKRIAHWEKLKMGFESNIHSSAKWNCPAALRRFPTSSYRQTVIAIYLYIRKHFIKRGIISID